MTIINETTPHLGLQLPHPSNSLEDDVGRLRSALGGIDSKFEALDTELGAIDASLTALDTLLASNDPAYNTLQEIVTALKANITALTSHVGASAAVHAAATSSVNGFMSAADKTKLDGVTLVTVAVSEEFTPTAGQTTFVVTGGYTPGRIWVFLNGIKLMSADFTATTSPNVVLAVGAAVTDTLEVVKFKQALAA